MWEDKVRDDLDVDTVRQEVLRFLGEFQDISGGRLENTDGSRHRIELTSEAKPIYRASYQAG